MIVKPKIRGFMCTTAHPLGCARNVEEQIAYAVIHGPLSNGPKKVLVIGSSAGYGLAARIVSAFSCGASTVGVFLDKPPKLRHTATPGWYNTCMFDHCARSKGVYAKHFNRDAFLKSTKLAVADCIAKDLGQVDLVVYSLAASHRVDSRTGKVFKSKLKSMTGNYQNKALDVKKQELVQIEVPKAKDNDVEQTIAVMGGDDWREWMELLMERKLLAPKAVTVAFSYIGPEMSQPIYRQGTVGEALDHLEQTARDLDEKMRSVDGRAFVSVNKAVVTQSSSLVPFSSLYLMLLMKVMKEKKIHEGCIEQVMRLFGERLYGDWNLPHVPVDDVGRIRLDEYELRADVQKAVGQLWREAITSNLNRSGEIDAFNREFLRLYGFGLDGLDYESDVDINFELEVV